MTAISEKSTCDRAPVLALLISSQGLTLSDYLADLCGDIHRWKWTMSKRAQTELVRSFLCWEERMGMRRETKHHFRLVSQHTFGQKTINDAFTAADLQIQNPNATRLRVTPSPPLLTLGSCLRIVPECRYMTLGIQREHKGVLPACLPPSHAHTNMHSVW